MSAVNSARPQLVEPGQTVAPPKPIDQIRHQLDRMQGEFAVALPQHIPVDRFKRIVLTAINGDTDLLTADRRSLMGACMKAAQDGLMPDKREGALVIFNTKIKREGKDVWIKAVQWMPMVYGIIKKMRNSGELASIVAHEVYEKDNFTYMLGDDERIEHKPYIGEGEPGKMIAVYAIAKLKDGTIQREVMTRAQVEKVRAVSKTSGSGPWVSWYEEMARKTVTRRLSKYLPMSTEIETMLRRDDALAAAGDTVDVSRGFGEGHTIEGESQEIDGGFSYDQDGVIDNDTQALTSEQHEPVPTVDPKKKADKIETKAKAEPQQKAAAAGNDQRQAAGEQQGEPQQQNAGSADDGRKAAPQLFSEDE